MVKFPDTIKRIAIFNASPVTRELPYSLLYALRNSHNHPELIDVVGSINYDSEELLYIIICPAGFGSNSIIKQPKYYITYQLEPTSVLKRVPYCEFLKGAITNWDYSQANVDYYNARPELGIDISYLPVGHTPPMTSTDILCHSWYYNEDEKDIDVLFLGWDAHARRRNIREQMEQAGLKVQFLINLDLFGMQKVIRRAKICLNMHALDNMINFETIRLNILLSNQACVVSEDINDDTKLIYDKHITIVPYDKLVSRCQELVMQPALRKEQAMKSYSWYTTQREWTTIVSFKPLLPSL